MKYNLCYVALLQGEDTKGRTLRQTLALYDRKTQKREKPKKKMKQKMVKHSHPELNEDSNCKGSRHKLMHVQGNRQIKKQCKVIYPILTQTRET